MQHADHVNLIRDGVEGVGHKWLELGAGAGAFTLALADLLGPDADIVAVDRDSGELRRLTETVTKRFPAIKLQTVEADFDRRFDPGPRVFDGLLAANALHFVAHPTAVIGRLHASLRPGARILVVEYDGDTGNPWVPHPFSFKTWQREAGELGLLDTRLVGRVPSRFLTAMYAAASDVPPARSPESSDQETSIGTS